jgi:uncharacterized delta-60 repeat protein
MRSNPLKGKIFKTIGLIFLMLTIGYAQGGPGSLDPSFGNSGIVLSPYSKLDQSRATMALQSDGKIVVTAPGFTLMRYNTDGSPDLTFGSDGKAETSFSHLHISVNAIAIQSDGKIVAAGGGRIDDDENTNVDYLLARYNTDGSLDSTFGSGGKVISAFRFPDYGPNKIAIQSDGKIVAVGVGETYSGSDFLLTRYNSNGSLDTSFGSGGQIINTFYGQSYFCNAVVIQTDGKIIAAGGSNGGFALARYNANGSLDTSFGAGGKVLTNFNGGAAANDLAIQPDGKIVAVGKSYSTFLNFPLARYNASGSLDSTFGTSGKVVVNFTSNAQALGVAIQTDGKIVTVGTSSRQGFTLARCNSDGEPDRTFGTNGIVITPIGNPDGSANGVVIQSDGKILVVGDVSNSYKVGLVRYLGDPVAAQASVGVSGRVLTINGNGLRNAAVSLTDSQGIVRTVFTSSLGFYSLDNVLAGRSYTIAVSSKRYRFASRSLLQLNADLANVDFVGMD